MGLCACFSVWFHLGCFSVMRRSFVVDLVCFVWNFVDCLCVCVVLFGLCRVLLCEC